MTVPSREPPEALRLARRSIDELPDFLLVHDLHWSYVTKRWVMCVEVTAREVSEHIPKTTRWWFHISGRYPFGDIEVYPAKEGGVTSTFHHQDANLEGDKGVRWREGDICVKTPAFGLGRLGSDADPLGNPQRLRWYFERVREWIEAAASGTLVKSGEPFELPHFSPHEGIVGFQSSEADFAAFLGIRDRVGVAEFAVLRAEPLQLVVDRFLTCKGDVIWAAPWGERVRGARQRIPGLWLRTESLPVLPPYQAPRTWGELREVFKRESVELDPLLRSALPQLRHGHPLFGVLGFPISKRFDGALCQMHWQAFHGRALSSDEDFARGFRKSEQAYWLRDKRIFFGNGSKIPWLHSENWAPSEIGSRGQLPMALRDSKVTLIGVGALGAQLSEMMVRGGVRDITVIDGDRYHVGNAVRHTLLLDDVDGFKATRVAERLNRVSPLAKARGIKALFPELDSGDLKTVQASALVIDCTGSDDVISGLSDTPFTEDTWFWSISISLGAKRMYAFSAFGRRFPAADFHQAVAPWVQKDRADNESSEMPWEGTGCWHPVFPGSTEEVSLMVATALCYLSEVLAGGRKEASLAVFERTTRDGLFSGVTRTDDAAK